MIHSLKPDPRTNIQSPDRYWDFMSLTPESTNMLTHLFTDEGIPASYREMRGSSVHAFKWINEHGNMVYVKLNWVPKMGIRNLSMEEAANIQAHDFNHATRDLYEAIERGDYPEWDLYVQILDPADLDNFDFHPLDATKDWLEEDIPSQLVGTMTLNRNPENVFAETEQVGFNPGNLVPGFEPSEDKMLQGRIFSYSDTQRYRVGANYLDLPINCPFAQKANNTRDGAMPIGQQTNRINYEPNRYQDTPKEAEGYEDYRAPINGTIGRIAIEKKNNFGQAGKIYRNYPKNVQDALIKNIANDLKQVAPETALRAICNFYRADEDYGQRLADAIGMDISEYVKHGSENNS